MPVRKRQEVQEVLHEPEQGLMEKVPTLLGLPIPAIKVTKDHTDTAPKWYWSACGPGG